jgi:hypothetical protein
METNAAVGVASAIITLAIGASKIDKFVMGAIVINAVIFVIDFVTESLVIGADGVTL